MIKMKTLKIIDIVMSILFLLSIIEVEILSYAFMDMIVMIGIVYMPISMLVQSTLSLKNKK